MEPEDCKTCNGSGYTRIDHISGTVCDACGGTGLEYNEDDKEGLEDDRDRGYGTDDIVVT